MKENEVLLLREAGMSSMAIATGLNHIRKYDFTQTGYFYSGLQSYCFGIERLLKLVLICGYRLDNHGAFPNNNDLKNFGHKIVDLIGKARDIKKQHAPSISDIFLDQDDIFQKIISLLTDFAMTARYYNLDYLSGKQQSSVEPLKRWDAEISSVLVERHYKPSPQKVQMMKNLGIILEEVMAVRHTEEGGSEISSMSGMVEHSLLVLTKQKYSMYYLYVLARILSELLADLEYKGGYFPYLREFFWVFMLDDKRRVLAKKTWSPMRS